MNKYERKPDMIVDFHGHTTREVGELLDTLLAENSGKHIRLITGKGDLRKGPVLRTYVEGYLKKRGIRFTRAKLTDGGDGALEVFLG